MDLAGKVMIAIDLAMKTMEPAKETADRVGNVVTTVDSARKVATTMNPTVAVSNKGRRQGGSTQEWGYAGSN